MWTHRHGPLGIDNIRNVTYVVNMTESKQSPEKILLYISSEQKQSVDEWRGKQPGVPNRSAAIRRLIDLGLKSSEKDKKSKK